MSNLKCSKFVKYKKSNFFTTEILMGILCRKGYLHKYIDFNTFEDKETFIPEGFEKVKLNKKQIGHFCDNKKEILHKNNEEYKVIKEKLKGYKTYFTHNNGGRTYLVYIKDKNKVYVYFTSDKKIASGSDYSNNNSNNKWMYINKISEYKPLQVFIGKSPLTPVTETDGSYGKSFDGNSILLKISNNKYVFIGDIIYEFKTEDNIIKFISPIGNNDVPYPVAIGKDNIYFMKNNCYVPISKFPKLTKEIENTAYMYFYGHYGDVKFEDYSKNMKKFKNIHYSLSY